MSRDRVELVRRAEAAFNTKGSWAIEEFVTHDVEWGTTGSFPGIDRVYRGPDGMDKWRKDLKSVWEKFEVSVVQVLLEAEDRLVVEERVRGRGKKSGVEVEMSIFSTYYFRDEKVARRVAHKERDEAIAAAAGQGRGTRLGRE